MFAEESEEMKALDKTVSELDERGILMREREKKILALIQSMTKARDNEASHAKAEEQKIQGEQEMEKCQLEEELAKVSQLKDALAMKVKDLTNQGEKLKEEAEFLHQQQVEIEQKKSSSVPGLRYDVNLFTYLTGIRWQYNCEQHEIKGYVSTAKGVKPFDLSSNENSQFFIANYLWDQIETDW